MSPTGPEIERALSPTGPSRIRPANGAPMQPFPGPVPGGVQTTAAAVPTRPKRADDPPDDPNRQAPGPRTESPLFQRGGDRAVSPDLSRAKGPNGATSPTQQLQNPPGASNGQPPNMTSVAMGRNGLSARSPSPNIDRSQPPPDAFYSPGKRSPTVVNGYPSANRPDSSPRPGSGGSVIADMLKQKEAELETARRRETWMRAALSKASKAGFVWDTDLNLGDGGSDLLTQENGAESEEDMQKLSDLVLALKRDRARIHVRGFSCKSDHLLSSFEEPCRGTSVCGVRAVRRG